MKKLLGLGFLIGSLRIGSAFAAIELNSSNIVYMGCPSSATSCDLSNKGITSIASGTFINHTNITYGLDLSENQISTIESGTFVGLSNTKYLHLDSNNITSIESGAFAGLPNLTYLVLLANKITTIPEGAFVGLSSLKTLELQGNQMVNIGSLSFSGLSNLIFLDLSRNGIVTVGDRDSVGLASLTGLNLDYNKITSLGKQSFSGLTNLSVLYLSHNQISSIEDGTFDHLPNLKDIQFYENKLNTIPDFGSNSPVKNLDLIYNSISSLRSGDFVGLSNLTWLRLPGTLNSIEPGSFNGLDSLLTLDLGTSLTSLEDGFFDGLSNLEELELRGVSRGKGLNYIREGTFDGLSHLKRLSLGWHNIKTLEKGAFRGLTNLNDLAIWYSTIDTIENGAFSGLDTLKVLDLQLNMLTKLESGDFVGLSNLTGLKLNDNKISTIEGGAFLGLANLKSLSLRNNKIQNIEQSAFVGLSNLPTLTLGGNNFLIIKSGALVGLSNLSTLDLGSTKGLIIQSGGFNGLSSLKDLRLNHCWLGDIPKGIFVGLSNLKTLNLSSNFISSIEQGDFAGLSTLTGLNLNANLITSIQEGDFIGLPNVVELNLSYNKLSSIEQGDFSGLGSLKKLYLGLNRLTSIRQGDLAGLSNLTDLSFYANDIKNIAVGAFQNLTHLSTFDLSYNQLVSVNGLPIGANVESNCFNMQDNNTIQALSGMYTDKQYVCADILYTPGDNNTVNGKIIFTGGLDQERNAIILANPNTEEYTWYTNGYTQFNLKQFNFLSNQEDKYRYGIASYSGSLWPYKRFWNEVNSYNGLNSWMDWFTNLKPNPKEIKIGTVNWLGNSTPVEPAQLLYTNPSEKAIQDNVFAILILPDGSEVTNNSGSNSYLFTRNGSFTFTYKDKNQYTGAITATVNSIAKGEITYSTTGTTLSPVMAVLAIPGGGTIINNSGLAYYMFTGNGSFTFTYQDSQKNLGSATATVTWIGAPSLLQTTPTISYSTTSVTSGDVIATISFSNGGTISNNGGSNTKLFTSNETFTFNFTDLAGNTGSAIASVSNIDKTKPTSTISYITNENGSVTSTLTLSETGTISNTAGVITNTPGWVFSHIFTEIGSFTFNFVDLVGNTGTRTVTINSMSSTPGDTTPPTGIISYTTNPNGSVTATITLSEVGTILYNGGSNQHTFTSNGSFVFQFTDLAGNNGYTTATVTSISGSGTTTPPSSTDITPPIGTISYSPNANTEVAGNVVATLSLNEPGSVTSAGGATHTFTSNGDFLFEFQDTAGNKSSLTASVDWIINTFAGRTVNNTLVKNNGIYNADIKFSFNNNNGVVATLDGVKYKSGTLISSEGLDKEFLLTDQDGYSTGLVFSIDKTIPSCSINSTSTLSGAFLNLQWDCNDNLGLSGLTLTINDENNNVLYTTGLSIFSRDFKYDTESGTYKRKIIAKDKAGNTSNMAYQQVAYTKTTTITITPSGNLYDSIYYISGYRPLLSISGNTWFGFQLFGDLTSNIMSAYTTGVLNQTIILSPGEGIKNIQIDYTNTNGYGRGSLDPISFYVDATNPTISPIYPTNQVYTTGSSMTFEWSATDTGVGISGYVLEITRATRKPTLVYLGSTSTNYTLTKMSNGTYTWKIKAIDYAGNTRETEYSTFTIGTSSINTDISPDSFSLDKEYDADLDEEYTSEIVTVSGLSTGTKVFASVNTGSLFVNSVNIGTTGYVQNGDKVQIALYSSENYDQLVSGTLTIGDQSSSFKIVTLAKGDTTSNYTITSLSTNQKLSLNLVYNALLGIYDEDEQDDFMLSFKYIVKDKIEKMVADDEDETKIEKMKYLYNTINKNFKGEEDATIIDAINNDENNTPSFDDDIQYTAPNGKKYTITHNDKGYTSSSFLKKSLYFNSLTDIKTHIIKNNPKSPYRMIDFTIDTSRTQTHIAPNGRKYILFKTTDGRYGSNSFIYGKTFTSLKDIQTYINQNNK